MFPAQLSSPYLHYALPSYLKSQCYNPIHDDSREETNNSITDLDRLGQISNCQ